MNDMDMIPKVRRLHLRIIQARYDRIDSLAGEVYSEVAYARLNRLLKWWEPRLKRLGLRV